MSISFCSFASGSSGNCYLVKSDTTSLLIDVGISGKKIFNSLDSVGLNIEDIKGIFITHEHIDHIKSVRIVSKKAKMANVFASRGTWEHINDLVFEEKRTVVSEKTPFVIGDITVKPFALSHDAKEPLGYTFSKDNKQIVIATDTGCVTEEMFSHLCDSDIMVLEANHEVNILRMGSYPYKTQQRILSDKGHLSNVDTGKCICNILEKNKGEKKPRIILAHMSRENNTPEQAYLTIKNILQENNFYIEKHLLLDVIGKDMVSPFFEV